MSSRILLTFHFLEVDAVHVLLCFLVDAESEEEARGLVESALNDMIDLGYIDFYSFTDEPGARWNHYNPKGVVPKDSPDGKRILRDHRNFLWKEFKERIQIVREILETFSDEEIFNKKPKPETEIALKLKEEKKILADMKMFQYWCYALSNHDPVYPGVVIVYNDGSWSPVRNGAEFDEAARDAKYIVTVDAHY